MPPPERWESYRPMGKVIPGTRLITFKVPLRKALCEASLPENEWFTPKILASSIKDMGYQIGLIIDLTFTTKYYGSHEFTEQGIQYEKIFTEGHNVPNDEVVYRFFDILEKFFEINTDENVIAGIHCTHGVNRTGYIVCRYMIERHGMDPQEAIHVFGEARGYPVERENYIEDLITRQYNPNYKYEGREKIPMRKFSRPPQTSTRLNSFRRNQDQRSFHPPSNSNPHNSSYHRNQDQWENHHTHRPNSHFTQEQSRDRHGFKTQGYNRQNGQYQNSWAEDDRNYYRRNERGYNYSQDNDYQSGDRYNNSGNYDRHPQPYRGNRYHYNGYSNSNYSQKHDGYNNRQTYRSVEDRYYRQNTHQRDKRSPIKRRSHEDNTSGHRHDGYQGPGRYGNSYRGRNYDRRRRRRSGSDSGSQRSWGYNGFQGNGDNHQSQRSRDYSGSKRGEGCDLAHPDPNYTKRLNRKLDPNGKIQKDNNCGPSQQNMTYRDKSVEICNPEHTYHSDSVLSDPSIEQSSVCNQLMAPSLNSASDAIVAGQHKDSIDNCIAGNLSIVPSLIFLSKEAIGQHHIGMLGHTSALSSLPCGISIVTDKTEMHQEEVPRSHNSTPTSTSTDNSLTTEIRENTKDLHLTK